MAYCFEIDESLAAGITRISREQAEQLRQCLSRDDITGPGIYEARKTIKRLRSLYLLVRPGMPADIFRLQNQILGNIGRRLGLFRDIDAMRETLQQITSASTNAPSPRGAAESKGHGLDRPPNMSAHLAYISTLHMALNKRHQTLMHRAGNDIIARTLTDLDKLDRLITQQNFSALDLPIISHGLCACYQKGAARLQTAIAADNSAHYHQCRKSVQQHWRHMQLLRRFGTEQFSQRTCRAKQLAHYLGKEHDLCVLLDFAHGQHRAKRTGNNDSETQNTKKNVSETKDGETQNTRNTSVRSSSTALVTCADLSQLTRYCRCEQKKYRQAANELGSSLFNRSVNALAKELLNAWQVRASAAKTLYRQSNSR